MFTSTDIYSLDWRRDPSSFSTLTSTVGITNISSVIEHPQATQFNQIESLSRKTFEEKSWKIVFHIKTESKRKQRNGEQKGTAEKVKVVNRKKMSREKSKKHISKRDS